jgi:hypothetical protein
LFADATQGPGRRLVARQPPQGPGDHAQIEQRTVPGGGQAVRHHLQDVGPVPLLRLPKPLLRLRVREERAGKDGRRPRGRNTNVHIRSDARHCLRHIVRTPSYRLADTALTSFNQNRNNSVTATHTCFAIFFTLSDCVDSRVSVDM